MKQPNVFSLKVELMSLIYYLSSTSIKMNNLKLNNLVGNLLGLHFMTFLVLIHYRKTCRKIVTVQDISLIECPLSISAQWNELYYCDVPQMRIQFITAEIGLNSEADGGSLPRGTKSICLYIQSNVKVVYLSNVLKLLLFNKSSIFYTACDLRFEQV